MLLLCQDMFASCTTSYNTSGVSPVFLLDNVGLNGFECPRIGWALLQMLLFKVQALQRACSSSRNGIFIGNKWSDAGTFEKTLCMRRRAFIERSQSSHFEVAQKNVREILRYLCSLAHNFNNSKVNHLNLASRPSLGDVRFHRPPRSHLARHLARQWFGRLW